MDYVPAEPFTLLDVDITTAVTGVVTTAVAPITLPQHGDSRRDTYSLPAILRGLLLDANFAWGSGGTTAKFWVQTSLDGGATWIDIASFAFTTAIARRLYHLTDAAVTSIATPTDGSLADNTALNGVLGAQYRVKYTTTGTYATTHIKIQAMPQ